MTKTVDKKTEIRTLDDMIDRVQVANDEQAEELKKIDARIKRLGGVLSPAAAWPFPTGTHDDSERTDTEEVRRLQARRVKCQERLKTVGSALLNLKAARLALHSLT